MKYLRILLIHIFLFNLISTSHSEITIAHPIENSVIQRDKNNNATLYISGIITDIVDKIEIKLTPVHATWGQASNWIEIEKNPSGGVYYGSVSWKGGWYILEVRGSLNNNVISQSTVNRVGIGEVFLVAGQSNAQGQFSKGSPSAQDERVIRIDYNGIDGPNAALPYPAYSRVGGEDVIAPRGKSAWAWGRLGDLLATRLNVPVLFFNTGWDGSSVKNWLESMDRTTYSVYDPTIPFNPSGMPYGNFKNVMQTYVAMSGVRAVLWTQGEADNDVRTSAANYRDQLSKLITTSRTLLGKNVSWVISKTSYTGPNGSNATILNAQGQVTSSVANTFNGPNTDLIQIPRPDNYHFSDQGLYQLAEAWSNSLNTTFFNNSTPIAALPPLRVQSTCANNAYLSLSIAETIQNASWTNGTQGRVVNAGEGRIQISGRDASNNFRYSPTYTIPSNFRQETPTIQYDGELKICQDGELTLRSNSAGKVVWSNGATSSNITVRDGGTYTVRATNAFGCVATSSSVVIQKINNPLPAAPVIAANGKTTICEGESLTLTTSPNTNIFWSNGETGGQTTVRTSGDYFARSQDSFGCLSKPSNAIKVNVTPGPEKPSIVADKATTFCEGDNITLTTNATHSITWSTGNNNRSITVGSSGTYSITTTDQNGCSKTSDLVTVRVNPLPKAPVITALAPTTICANETTTLIADPQHSYIWSNGNNNRQITVNTAGNYTVSTRDANGCLSAPSVPTTVKVNPIPAKPSIIAEGPTTFCASDGVTLAGQNAVSYQWNNGATSQKVAITQSGNYTLKVGNDFGCFSEPSSPITINALPVPATPTVHVSGPTEFCKGEEVTLTTSGAYAHLWNNGAQSGSLSVGESGDYQVRIQGDNGCYSFYSEPVKITVRETPTKPTIEKVGTYSVLANSDPNVSFEWRSENGLLENQGNTLKLTRFTDISTRAYIKYPTELVCYSDPSDIFYFTLDANDDKVSVYPNPIENNYFYLESMVDYNNATIQIYSLDGKLVYSEAGVNLEIRRRVDLPTLSSGVYILKLVADKMTNTKKIVINK